MAKNVNELFAQMSPERRAKIEREVEEVQHSPLYALGKAQALTQDLSENLGLDEPGEAR